MLTAEQKKQIADKVEACFVKAEAHYKRKLRRQSSISYDLKGGTAGTANPRTLALKFNPALALRDWNEILNGTVPHEVAHLIDYEINNKLEQDMLARAAAIQSMHMFGRRRKMPKRDVHGPSWKSVMRVLGANPERCHHIDATGIVRRKGRHDYQCSCGEKIVIGAKHHNAILRGAGVTHRGCGRVLTRAMWLGKQKAMPAPTPVAMPAPRAPEAPPAPRVGTKLDRAVQIVGTHGNASKDYLVALLMRELTMSKAGATTYYYQAKARC